MTLNWICAVRAERLRVIPIFAPDGRGVFMCLTRHVIFLPLALCAARRKNLCWQYGVLSRPRCCAAPARNRAGPSPSGAPPFSREKSGQKAFLGDKPADFIPFQGHSPYAQPLRTPNYDGPSVGWYGNLVYRVGRSGSGSHTDKGIPKAPLRL